MSRVITLTIQNALARAELMPWVQVSKWHAEHIFFRPTAFSHVRVQYAPFGHPWRDMGSDYKYEPRMKFRVGKRSRLP